MAFDTRPECVPGVVEVNQVTCNSTGGNVSVPTNYTCNTGFYVVPAPTYCQRMFVNGIQSRQGRRQ
jgi:hypothetical protein